MYNVKAYRVHLDHPAQAQTRGQEEEAQTIGDHGNMSAENKYNEIIQEFFWRS